MYAAARCAVIQAFLVRTLLAERKTDDIFAVWLGNEQVPAQSQRKAKDLISSQDTICGGPEIWFEITKEQTSSGIQNINWKKIDAIAEAYVKKQETNVKTTRAHLEHLAADIARLRGKEHIRDATQGELHKLITAGIAPFESLDNARRTNCGSPAARPRAPRSAKRDSAKGFGPEAEKLFQVDGSVRLGHAPFSQVCKEMLTCENEQISCYCDHLCQEFRDTAQGVSDNNVGEHHGKADELVRKENAMQDELLALQKEITECQEAKAQLHEFGGQIGLLKQEAHARHEIFQDAEERLYDAQEDLADLEDQLVQEEKEEAEAMEILTSATGDFDKATAALAGLSTQEQALVGSVNGSVAALGKARSAMDEAMGADKAMNQLRELVSVTVMKMEMFFDQAVQAPVRRLGIDMDLDLDTVFVGTPEEMTSAGAMREAVDSLAGYCGEDGQAAILSMKGKVDLAPLCKFETADAIKKDINVAVTNGLKIVRARIEQVKGWLNPYRGQVNMNDKVAEGLVSKGEPAGLRRIVSTYGSVGFYKNYLKLWKIGGPFLKLLGELNTTVYSLQASVNEMTSSLAELQNQLAKTTAAREVAEQELNKATDSKQLAQDKQAELKGHVEAMRAQGEKMKKNIEDLQAQVEEAQRRYNEALEQITAAHKEHTSFLEAWDQIRHEVLEELRAEAVKARDDLASASMETDKAEQRYQLAMAKVAELKN